jgi:hypothetical protein
MRIKKMAKKLSRGVYEVINDGKRYIIDGDKGVTDRTFLFHVYLDDGQGNMAEIKAFPSKKLALISILGEKEAS